MVVSTKWPELCAQNLTTGDWWCQASSTVLQPGLLIRALLPHVDQIPLRLNVLDRTDPKQHEQFQAKLEPYNIRSEASKKMLPVAALPLVEGEAYSLHRAKIRPALVLSANNISVPETFRSGAPKWQSAPTILVAPYYGADQDGSRSGWKKEFVERIQILEYPQYFWDCLPIGGTLGSILRLDHLQPIGIHQNSYTPTGYTLSKPALALVHHQLAWLLSGSPAPVQSAYSDLRDALGELDK